MEWGHFVLETSLFLEIVKVRLVMRAMTPDLTAVNESRDTNGHLCKGCLVIIHPCLAVDYWPNLTLSK